MAIKRNPILMALVFASAAVIWGLAVAFGLSARSMMLRDAEDEVSRMSQVVAEQTAGLMEEIKVYLMLMDTWIQDNPGADPRTDPRFVHLIENLRNNARFRIDLRFVSEDDGLYYVPSKDSSKPLAMVGDREYVQVQKSPATRGFHIAGPVLSRVTNLWGIPISYPLTRHSSGLATIFAAVELPLLSELYESVRPKPDGAISLIRSDGVLLCRAPLVEKDMGRNLSLDPAWKEPSEGVQERRSVIDGKVKIVAYRSVSGFPLMVSVSVDRSRVEASWLRAIFGSLLLLAAATALILSMGVHLLRNWKLLASSDEEKGRLNIELSHNMEAVRRQLDEKELLIRETNHRVKNHMAQLVALIDLTEATGSKGVVEALRSRLHSYALLYEKLSYSSGAGGRLDLGDYVEDLSRRLIEVATSALQVSTRVEAEHAMVPARECSALGLILSELVTNSLKYAVPADGALALGIEVGFSDGRIRLGYSDNGPGFDFESLRGGDVSSHVGMILIDTMLAQYGGSVSYSRDGGSRFEIVM